MIEYRGRQMPCFMARQTHLGGCSENASHLVDGSHVFMHMCEPHATDFCARNSGYTMTSLKPPGELDRLNAETLDPHALLEESPWIESANGITRQA